MNQSDCSGKTLKPWPVFVDHYRVTDNEQGIASGMASTTLNVGNAIGIALLIALSGSGAERLSLEASGDNIANALQLAFYLAAAGQITGLLISRLLPHKAINDLSVAST